MSGEVYSSLLSFKPKEVKLSAYKDCIFAIEGFISKGSSRPTE